MLKSDLELMSVEQLRTVLDNIGIEYHHKSGANKLIETILNAQTPKIEPPRAGAAPDLEEEHTATQELKPIKRVPLSTDYPTPEEVSDAIAPFVQRGLEVLQLDEEEGYHFKKGRKEDSGNLKQPLRRIVDCASRLV